MKITKPFQDSEVLGRFTGPTINQVAQAEELRCAYERIAELEATLGRAQHELDIIRQAMERKS